jgi:hypothetical protein
MPASNTYVRSASVALPSADGCRASSVVALGCVLVVIGAGCFCPSVFAQSSDSPTAEEPTKSWTATTHLKSDDLIPERIPVRIIERHRQNGNRTSDKRSVEIIVSVNTTKADRIPTIQLQQTLSQIDLWPTPSTASGWD